MKIARAGILFIVLFSFRLAEAQPIIGGVNAAPGEFPFIAGLTMKSEPNLFDGTFCGASLISPEWVLTAAHCMYDDADQLISAGAIEVFLNVWKLSAPGSHERIGVSQVIVHPNYNSMTLDNDIALLRLSKSSAQPAVKLVSPSQTNLYQAKTVVTIAGWGLYDEKNELYADVLRKADIEVIAESTCNAATAYDGEITANMFCAGKEDGSKDACSGDSGGPMVYYDGSTAIQTGIVSWGEGCALAGFPGIYTRLVNYLGWISGVTGLSSTAEIRKQQLGFQSRPKADGLEFQMEGENTRFSLMDAGGRVVNSGPFEKSQNIQYRDFESGIYYLQCSSDLGTVMTKIVIPAYR